MRLTAHTWQRHRRGARMPRISISQEEITADLIYPARRPSAEHAAAGRVARRQG